MSHRQTQEAGDDMPGEAPIPAFSIKRLKGQEWNDKGVMARRSGPARSFERRSVACPCQSLFPTGGSIRRRHEPLQPLNGLTPPPRSGHTAERVAKDA